MEILHTSLEQWAGTSPITNHDFHDMAQYTAYLKNVQSKAALRMYDSEPFLNDWLSSHYADLSLSHMHTDFIEITYVHSGAGVAVLNDTKRMIQKGDIAGGSTRELSAPLLLRIQLSGVVQVAGTKGPPF